MHYFTSQLRTEQEHVHSLRAANYRKRRRVQSDAEHDEQRLSHSPEAKPRSQVRPQSYASYASSELAQLRTAGLLPEEEDEVPVAPFPHAPTRTSRAHYGAVKAHEDLAKLPTPLYAAGAATKEDSVGLRTETDALKRTHLDVLTAIMHRCLLERDYERAGRAWGIILRTQVSGGHPVDVRNNGRWGIGAEILLHRTSAADHRDQQQSPLSDSTQGMFSEEGFELAKEYYERLIVQYPHRRTLPHAIDERTFYPAMFSLWICEISEKSQRAMKKITDQAERRSRASRSMSSDSIAGRDLDSIRPQQDAVKLEELTRAMEVAERLDRLIVSPPFDKQASLLQLRGNVSLWVADLILGRTSPDEDWEMDGDAADHGGRAPSVEDRLTRLAGYERELQRTQSYCKRAESNGATGQAATLASISIKLRQCARQAERLRTSRDGDEDSSMLLSSDQ